MERVTIRVPATTANLAAGFDVLGCAVGVGDFAHVPGVHEVIHYNIGIKSHDMILLTLY